MGGGTGTGFRIKFEEMHDLHYCIIKYDKGDIKGKVDYIEQGRFKELINYNKIELLNIYNVNLNEESAKKVLKNYK